MQNFAFLLALCLIPGSLVAYADVRSDLLELRAHPDTHPVKRGAARVKEHFSPARIADASFVAAKDALRKNFCTLRDGRQVCLKDVLPGRAPIARNEQVEDLVGYHGHLLKTLEKMEKKGLRSAALADSPWSDTYWPLFKGAIADRYADPKAPSSKDWKENWNYVHVAGQNLADIIAGGAAEAIDLLSPAEKYDLLIGDAEGSLTAANWSDGEGYFKDTGKVEDWMGLCNGWAPASFSLPRPAQAVTTLAADGRTPLTFYPADIKALGTLLWAKADVNYNFMGGRCNSKKPHVDENNHILNRDCFDTNPGAWHMGVVNQLGLLGRGLVIDATYDYEVWNQPVSRYTYSYFNPQSLESVPTLAEATVALEDLEEDRFDRFRAKDAVAIVGIVMDLTYMDEADPTHAPANSPAEDKEKTVRYYYDLELDERRQIVGGEWYQTEHPDFVWTPPAGTRAMSPGDATLSGRWKTSETVPLDWQPVGNFVSKTAGSPLAHVVEALFKSAAGHATPAR